MNAKKITELFLKNLNKLRMNKVIAISDDDLAQCIYNAVVEYENAN